MRRRALIIVAVLALTPAAGAAGEATSEMTHSLLLLIQDPATGVAMATGEYAASLTGEVRSGNDLNEDGTIDALEKGAFEELVNDRLSARPWAWSLDADGAPMAAESPQPYEALNIGGSTSSDEQVRIVSQWNVSAAGGPNGSATEHTWTASIDPEARSRAPSLGSLMVLIPEHYAIRHVDGLSQADECMAMGSGHTPWSITFAPSEGACTMAEYQAEINESLEAVEEAVEREKAERADPSPDDPQAGDPTPAGQDPPAPREEETPAPGLALLLGAGLCAALLSRRRG